MAFIGTISDGLGADSWKLFKTAVVTLQGGQSLQPGQLLDRNILAVQGRNDVYPQFSRGDLAVLPTDPAAGFNNGVFYGGNQALTNTNTAAGTFVVPIYYQGTVQVRAAALAGGTAVTVGGFVGESAAIGASLSEYATATAGYTPGQTLGIVMGYQIATTSTSAVTATGSQVVTMTNVYGMNTTTALIFDYQGPAGVAPQEAITPSAVTQGVQAAQTLTIAGTAGAGTTIVATVGGLPGGAVTVTYLTQASDTTATIIAAKIAALFNQSNAVRLATPGLTQVVNTAGVITLGALAQGASANAYTLVATATGGTVTAVAGGATFAGGTNPSITAVFANTHVAGATVLGQQTTSGATIIAVPATANTANVGLITVDIPSIS